MTRTHVFCSALGLFLVGSGCNKAPAPSADAETKVGDSLAAYHYKDIYFAGQPSEADWTKLKEQGFAHVVNLRKSEEGDYREESQAKQLAESGMTYTHVPWSTMDAETIQKVTDAVVKHRKDGKTLVHCGSGNRVGMWIAAHFYLDHGQSKEEALTTAKGLGLTKPGAVKVTEEYLAKVTRP